MAERPYYVENVTGDARTRMHRANASQTQRCKLFIGGQRLLPGAGRLPLDELRFQRLAAELKQMVLDGKIVLTTPEGMKITSRWTGEFILTRADGASKMLPLGEVPDCFTTWEELEAAPKALASPPPPAPEPEPEQIFASTPEAEPAEESRPKRKKR